MSLREIFAQLKALLLGLSPAKRATLAVMLAGLIAGFCYLMIWTGQPDYGLLYANLHAEDAGGILSWLKERKVQYQIAENGTAVMVPKEKVYELRLEMASQGLPQGSGVGFEIFDNAKLGITEFAQNVNYQRAIQGELTRTINGFDEVDSSRVHIVMANRSLFLDSDEPATASVVLKLKPGRELGKDQIKGIVHLISSSVSGLSPENVTVVDSNGKMLSGFEDKAGLGHYTVEQMDYQSRIERHLEQRIDTMLGSALGPDKAVVRVSCLLDFKKVEETEELYLPDNQVVRSEQSHKAISQNSASIPSGVPGVMSNLATVSPSVGSQGGQSGSVEKQEQTVNYEIGRRTSHKLHPVGTVSQISVAVLVDGTYRPAGEGEGKKEMKYIPRTPEEMTTLENIVKGAINFNTERGDRVEIANIPFEAGQTAQAETVSSWTDGLQGYAPFIKYGFAGLILILSFIFVARPMVKWLTTGSHVADEEILKQLPKTVGEVEREYGQKPRQIPGMERVSQLVIADSESSVDLVRQWLNETNR